jgi:hypothetical protein
MTTVTVLQGDAVPEAIRSLSTMADPDYVDCFILATSAARDLPAEEWALATDEVIGLAGQFVWRGVLGLRLAPRSSPDHVGGWTIVERGDDWIRLEAESWLVTAHIVVLVDDERLSAATFVRYQRRIAAAVWRPLSVLHRRAVPGFLRRTVRNVEARAGSR